MPVEEQPKPNPMHRVTIGLGWWGLSRQDSTGRQRGHQGAWGEMSITGPQRREAPFADRWVGLILWCLCFPWSPNTSCQPYSTPSPFKAASTGCLVLRALVGGLLDDYTLPKGIRPTRFCSEPTMDSRNSSYGKADF